MWDVLETFMPLFLVVRLIDSKELKKKTHSQGSCVGGRKRLKNQPEEDLF